MAKQYTKQELEQLLDDQYGKDSKLRKKVVPTINKYLARGDGLAIYKNVDMSHSGLGQVQMMSYGNSGVAAAAGDPPPDAMPMIQFDAWRYFLAGTYKGEPLEVK